MPEKKNFEWVGCDDHRTEFLDEMWKFAAKLVIGKFTQNVNRILSGKVISTTECIIQKKAQEFKVKRNFFGKYAPPLAQ